jgi:diguanylate cyclase (GGDEF)-like protein
MNLIAPELRSLLARWRAEDAIVARAAAATNVNRVRWIAPIVAALNLLHVIALGWQLSFNSLDDNASKWTWALFVLHCLMGTSMVVCAVIAHRLRYATRSFWVQGLSVALVCIGTAFSIAVVTVDQWITTSITPFLLCCLITSVVIYLRPVSAAMLQTAAYFCFFYALGLTQGNPQVLLSNRLNGIAACVMGWALSVMLWRKFCTLSLQQAQLEKANVELQTKQRELERLTRLDGLTGLFNRNTFVELTRQELDRAQRQGSDTALLLLDLDHFKRVNDTWGHPAGDAVLRNVAGVASRTVRSTDLVGRLGGEEFIVLLPSTSLEAARKIAEKLRQRLEASPTPWAPSPVTLTASIGVSGTTALEKRNFDSLYTEADKALYLAKTRGRNRVMS